MTRVPWVLTVVAGVPATSTSAGTGLARVAGALPAGERYRDYSSTTSNGVDLERETGFAGPRYSQRERSSARTCCPDSVSWASLQPPDALAPGLSTEMVSPALSDTE